MKKDLFRSGGSSGKKRKESNLNSISSPCFLASLDTTQSTQFIQEKGMLRTEGLGGDLGMFIEYLFILM
jgi:hypothetical protein